MQLIRLFRLMWREITRPKDFPPDINYEITNKCNLRCHHCYRETYPRESRELTDKQWISLWRKHIKKGALSAHLTGGEPTLRMNLIKKAYKMFKTITIVTNGTRKIPEEVQCRIFVSVDGPKKIHEKIRGAKCFDKIMKNIKGDKRVIITPTLSTANYKYIDDMIKITREADVDGITFSTYVKPKGPKDPLYLEGKKLDWTINKLREVLKKDKDVVLLTPNIISIFKDKRFYKKCFFMQPSKFLSFDPEGETKIPCVMGPGMDCSTCGCIAPVVSYSLFNEFDIKGMLMYGKRILPKKYSYI
ncbi:MAG: radical SAM protein [archaeon]|nr:MAG: radical SAM protein [archaeon]